MTSTRKLPVPFDIAKRRVGRGHLVPDVTASSGGGFRRLPGLIRVQYGLIAHVGAPITAHDVLHRLEEESAAPDAGRVGELMDQYLQQLQEFKIGNVIEISYGPGGFILTKVAETPHFPGPSLPE
jgi:hypothetical protein